MGSVKLCVHKIAKTPYLVEATGIYLFSIEELAYYLYENIYLVDDCFVEEKLYSWIENELEMPNLAEKLRMGRNTGNHVYNQVMTILQVADYHSKEELFKVSEKIASISGLQTQERMKYKADDLMQNENYWAAITEYERVLSIRQNSRLSVGFYAKVWNNLGGCYARLFLFEKSAECYDNAYQFQKIAAYKERAEYARKLNEYSKGQSEDILKQLEAKCGKMCIDAVPRELLKNWEKSYSKISGI